MSWKKISLAPENSQASYRFDTWNLRSLELLSCEQNAV